MRLPIELARALGLLPILLAAPLQAQIFLTVDRDPPGVLTVDASAGAVFGERLIDLSTAQPPIGNTLVATAIWVNSEIWVAAGAHVYRYNSSGQQLGATGPFSPRPSGLAFDGSNVWVAAISTIWKLDLSGSLTGSIPTTSAHEIFAWNGQLLVSDTTGHRINLHDANGQFLSVFASAPLPTGSFFSPEQLALQPANGNILVQGTLRLFEFDPTGAFVAEYEAGSFEHGVTALDDGRLLVNLYEGVVVHDPATGHSATVPGLEAGHLGHISPPAAGSAFLRYCPSNANSTGQSGQVGAFGSVSVARDEFALHASRVPPSQFGFFFYGPNMAQIVWGDGLLCTGPSGIQRIRPGLPITAAGIATRDVSFAALPASGAILPGSTWSFQFVFRDPTGGPAGFNSTDAVRLTFTP